MDFVTKTLIAKFEPEKKLVVYLMTQAHSNLLINLKPFIYYVIQQNAFTTLQKKVYENIGMHNYNNMILSKKDQPPYDSLV